MPRGGKRPGAGCPKGTKHKRTIERDAIRKAFAELLHARAMPVAARYVARAEGVFVMMVPSADGPPERVRNERRIVQLMSDPELKNGRDYFLIEAVAPDAKVLLDFMARFDGKPTERVEIVTPEPIRVRFVDA